ncbi:hypothetical protein VTO42DRAFT_3196 [Malbranchea cinnamomea]
MPLPIHLLLVPTGLIGLQKPDSLDRTTISGPSVKIPRSFKGGFSLYKTLFRTKVVTGSETALHPKFVQPGNTEWVTIVEGVNETGWSLPPMTILKGKWYQASWYENGLPVTWRIETSESGWTNEKLGMIWLNEVQGGVVEQPEIATKARTTTV